MTQLHSKRLSKGAQWSLEFMAVVYVAVMAIFLVNPDLPILTINKAFASYDWPVVFFPTEKFWFSLAASVPGTRAFLAFSAARRPSGARLCINILNVSLLLAAALFAWQFIFHKHAPLYLIGFFTEFIQVVFYSFLCKKLPS